MMTSPRQSAVKYASDLYANLINEVDERKKHQNEARKSKDSVTITSIDLNLSENTEAHHTSEFEQCASTPLRLVIRRGQPFNIKLHFDRVFNPDSDALMVEMEFGPNPAVEKMTQKILEVVNKDYSAEIGWNWAAKIVEIEGNTIDIRLQTSAASPVGEWRLKIYAGSRLHDLTKDFYLAYTYPEYIYVLFNPWCKEDSVYLENEEEREEYVLNDFGAVWRGAKFLQYSYLPWNFGQFEDVSLYTALVTLRDGDFLSDEDRADPILVTRKLTLAVNENILQGNWGSDFDDGTAPWKWTGSASILEQYINKPIERVKYGQCWVFAGVLNTLLRTLGIPARPVTNIRSAHDTDKSLTIDYIHIKNPSGEYDTEKNDSIWNFHVWNEAWFMRPDLPDGFDGWQACDSTPQECSEGRTQCGPMSVTAIRRGDVKLNYDGWFIYGEVNADVVDWYYVTDYSVPMGKRLVRTNINKHDVGRSLITSAPGNAEKPINLIENYKPKEGSIEERAHMRHAVRTGVQKNREQILELYKQTGGVTLGADDVEFTLDDLNALTFGDSILSQLTLRNTSKDSREIKWRLKIFVLRYTGAKHALIKEVAHTTILQGNQVRTVSITGDIYEYGTKLAANTEICVDATAVVQESEQIYSKRDVFMVEKPEIYLEPKSPQVKINQPVTVKISLVNPMNLQLHDCHLMIEGCGLIKSLPINCPKHLPGRDDFKVEHTVIPRRLGKRTLLAVFNSKELANLRGTCVINVTKN